MTKMNWQRAAQRTRDWKQPPTFEQQAERAANRYRQLHKSKPTQPPLIPSTVIHYDTAEWRILGPDCPWNPNPGKRLTFHNGKLVDVI